MNALSYSLAQIEAFASVAEQGSITKAAQRLGKDRSTVSELLEFFETELGYALFTRTGRSLTLTPEGKRLQRQARLLLRQAQAFGTAAKTLSSAISDEISVVYDPFVPRAFVHALIDAQAARGVRLSAWCGSRADAEAALVAGTAQLAITLARNQSVNGELEWRAMGRIDMSVYASETLLGNSEWKVTLRELAALPQIVMHRTLDEQFARQVQISDHVVFVNELDTLAHMLRNAQGWGFLPTHLHAERWPGVQIIDTEMGSDGLSHAIVAVWKPGTASQTAITDTLEVIDTLWKEVMALP
ncbi:LysR family transcriptional regulator [Paraburkholderia sp. C35]|uniref:LysR family transcriptional regulator n=1 Tax=Paraburkholderia sp. C35 TaxID=2126993 RepID=UPI000D69B81F|nr:LysR family transcriptional regulator [Paraburkholderia sp. C35]